MQPLSTSDWTTLGNEATKLRKTYSDSELVNQAEDLDANNWAAEGLELAKKYVYADINENELPSDEYIKRGATVAQRQIVLAGTRLANMLVKYDYS